MALLLKSIQKQPPEAGQSVVGCLPAEEKAVQEEIENPEKYHEQIVREWSFNFNDSPFPKKRNLCRVIYIGEQAYHIYSDLADPQVLVWASHVKCKTGGNSKFEYIHMI